MHLEDSAIIERDANGVAHVRNELSGATETGAVIGAVIGGFVAFAFPPAGIAIGAALGGAIGALMHTGVEGSFVKDVEKQLTPGKSALFLVAKEAHMDAWSGPSGRSRASSSRRPSRATRKTRSSIALDRARPSPSGRSGRRGAARLRRRASTGFLVTVPCGCGRHGGPAVLGISAQRGPRSKADAIRGTFRSWATELTVPGGAALPASAIAAVTVRPTHRRRGILT